MNTTTRLFAMAAVCIVLGFGLGAYCNRAFVAKPSSEALASTVMGHTDTLLAALHRIRQHRHEDAAEVLESSLEAQEIMLQADMRQTFMRDERTRILARIEEYRKGAP